MEYGYIIINNVIINTFSTHFVAHIYKIKYTKPKSHNIKNVNIPQLKCKTQIQNMLKPISVQIKNINSAFNTIVNFYKYVNC